MLLRSFIFLLLPLCCTVNSHAEIDSLFHELFEAEESGDFSCYYNSLNLIERAHIIDNEYERVYQTEKFYDYLPKTAADSIIYRKNLMLHGHRLRRFLGQVSYALSYYLKAHNYLRNKNELDGLAWVTEKHIASLYARLNDFDRAFHFASMVEDYLIHTNQIGKLGRLYSDIGDLYKWKGNNNEAIFHFEKGIRLGKEAGNLKAVVANQTSLCKYYLENGCVEEYLKIYNEIEQDQKQIKISSNDIDRKVEIKLLYVEYLKRVRDLDQAETILLENIEMYKERYPGTVVREIAKTYNSLVGISLSSSDIEKANSYYNLGMRWLINDFTSGAPNKNQLSNENTFVDLLLSKAKIYGREAELSSNPALLDSVLFVLDKALDANNTLHNGLLMKKSRLISVAVNKEILSKAVKTCYKQWLRTKDEDYVSKAIKYAYYSKASLLRSKRLQRKMINQLPKEKREHLSILSDRMIGLLNRNNTGEISSKDFQNMFYSVKDSLSRLLPNTEHIEHGENELSSPYLEYVWTDESVYVINNFDTIPIVEIPLLTVKEKITALQKQIDKKEGSEYFKCSQELCDLIIPKSISALDNLLIIPDGELLTIPFDLLCYKDKFLFEELEIKYKFIRENDKNDGVRIMDTDLICIAPIYKDSIELDGVRSSNAFLLFANQEANDIKNVWPGKVKIERSMSLSHLDECADDYNIFHFAGHAVASGDDPQLILNSDSIISSSSIEESNFNFDLVTLSACETGLGQFENGEGVRSLAYGFLSSGVKNIVYSLWAVNDQSSSKLMSHFYRELLKGNSVNQSLRNAKLKYLQQSPNAQKHPYYWAGFISVGSDISFPETKSLMNLHWIISLVAVIIFLLYLKTKSP